MFEETLFVKDPSKNEAIIRATIRILFVDLRLEISEELTLTVEFFSGIILLYKYLEILVNKESILYTAFMNQSSIFKPSVMFIIVILIILAGAVYVWIAKSKSQTVSSGNLHAKDVALLGREHVKVGTKVEYNSNPPTSGNHYEVWTKSGVYDKPQDDRNMVHSLEHGYIILSYNCGLESSKFKVQSSKLGTGSAEMGKDCLSFVNKLKDLVKKDSWKMILVPRPSLDANFALTAWGKIDKFNSPSGEASAKDASLDRVKTFIEAFRNHGPEQTME